MILSYFFSFLFFSSQYINNIITNTVEDKLREEKINLLIIPYMQIFVFFEA
jgi:hypothetical protein